MTNVKEPEPWLSRAIQTYNYHAKKLKEHKKWTVRDTAKSLGRSLGSICEDMLLARWSKTHNLNRFDHAYEALEFIRERQRKLNQDEISA